MSIADNVALLQEEIASACEHCGRSPDAVSVVAVTKSQGPEVLPQLAAAGITNFGENRLDHLQVMQEAAEGHWTFHGIGRLQSRQLPEWVARCSLLHSLHDPRHLARLNRSCEVNNHDAFPVFIQVNTSGEDAKAGCEPASLTAFLDQAAQYERISVRGLMCMPPKRAPDGSTDSIIRRCFADLRELAEQHHLSQLSMGMSGDFDLAIAEGATDIRVGTRLFL